jgi:hypothetical protein
MTLQMIGKSKPREALLGWEASSSPLRQQARSIRVDVSANKPRSIENWHSPEVSLASLLFDASAKAKQWTSSVSMRIEDETRMWLFRQLDRLHEIDEWFEGNEPIDLSSYKTFVRAIIAGYISGKPALALTPDGRVVAIWQNQVDKLIIDFFTGDNVRYLVTQTRLEMVERFAGNTSSERLREVLVPFNSGSWFSGR